MVSYESQSLLKGHTLVQRRWVFIKKKKKKKKTLGKILFRCQNDWSGNSPAGQF